MSFARSGAVLRRSPLRWATLLLPAGFAGALVRFDIPGLSQALFVLLLASFVPFFALSRFRRKEGKLTVSPRELRLNDRRLASWSPTAWGLMIAGSDIEEPLTLVMTDNGRPTLRLAVDAGPALLRAARLTRDEVIAQVRLFRPGGGAYELVLAAPVVLAVLNALVVLAAASNPRPILHWMIPAIAVVDVLLWMGFRWFFMRLRIGRDGIWLQEPGSVQFIRAGAVKEVVRSPRWGGPDGKRHPPQYVDVVLHSGKHITLPTIYARRRVGQFDGDYICEELRQLLQSAEEGPRLEALACSEEHPAKWIAKLRALPVSDAEQSTYRERALRPSDLWAVCESAASSPRQRAASAVVLATHWAESSKERLLDQARATACLPLADAFRAAALGRDAALERSLGWLRNVAD